MLTTTPGQPFARVKLGGREPQAPALVRPAEAKALGQADRLGVVEQLASGLAHEMNTPLGCISAHAEEALDRLSEDAFDPKIVPDLRVHLAAIVRQVTRCSHIATRLLKLARPARPMAESTPVGPVIGEVCRLFAPVARAREVHFDQIVEPDLPDAPISAADLEQVLVSLVQNSLDACVANDAICIQACRFEDDLLLIVEDTGSGIMPEVLGRAFDPFFTTKPVGQGTGLGLSVCHGIIASLGGTIELASAPDVGTRVSVMLPLQTPAEVSVLDQMVFDHNDQASSRRTSARWRRRYHDSIRISSLGKLVP